MAHKKPPTIDTLVLPVAGLGKRLRPLTLRTPKNLVKVAGRPLIDYVLEDAARSGIRRVIVVASPIHVGRFEKHLRRAQKQFGFAEVHVRSQKHPLGDGHAILQAHDILGAHPVAVRFCDDVIESREPVIGSLMAIHGRYGAPVTLIERVAWDQVSRYGIAGVSGKVRGRPAGFPRGHIHTVNELIEKPEREAAPSNLAVIGGYIVTPRIIRNLHAMFRNLKKRHADALRLISGFQRELAHNRPVYGWEFKGVRLDCGTLEGYYTANDYLLRRAKKKSGAVRQKGG